MRRFAEIVVMVPVVVLGLAAIAASGMTMWEMNGWWSIPIGAGGILYVVCFWYVLATKDDT